MRRFARQVLPAAAAALTLAVIASTSSARNLSSSSSTFTATWNAITFNSPEIEAPVVCRFTLAGSLHSRTFAKVRGGLIGSVTNATFAHPCTSGGEFFTFNGREVAGGRTLTNTLPWHLTYEAFAGTLPNITSLDLLLSRFRLLMQFPFICAASYGNETDNIVLRASLSSGVATTLSPVEGRNLLTRVTTLSGICPATASLTGSTSTFTGDGGARITIRLI